LLIQHSKYSAMLSKILFYTLLFWRFCPLGELFYIKSDNMDKAVTKQIKSALIM